MRALFATQSDSVAMFEGLREVLDRRVGVERAGFVVADSWAYRAWLRQCPNFEQRGHLLLKEWQATAQRNEDPDPELLARYERELGGAAGLFGAIVADRRLYMGPDCTYSQDYRRRFSDRQLLSILQNALRETERIFDELQPDVVVGFICVTLLDYLVYLMACARGIRYLNLRPTRIGDRVSFGSTLNDPTPEFVAAYQRARQDGSKYGEAAQQYIRRVREQHGRYEGVIGPSAKPALKVNRARRSPLAAIQRVLANYRAYRASEARTDNHVPDPLRNLAFAALVNPYRARRAARLLEPHYVSGPHLSELRYAFYPLHTEPEVSLLVYGRPYVNQIEVIRALAMSLPADTVLVVKEHPWMVGKRSMGAYRKLLDIPRVRLASPALEARELVAHSRLVAVVTGSVALEAAMLGKPVITFGDCPYNALPATMVQRCRDPRALPEMLKRMLANAATDEEALEAYVAGVFDTSESVNLYSVLLNKQGVHSERQSGYTEELEKLAGHMLACLDQPPSSPTEASSAW